MLRTLAVFAVLAALAPGLLAPGPAHAGGPPADCSESPAPGGPLALHIDDAAHPLSVATLRSQQTMTLGEGEGELAFEVFALSLRDAGSIFPPHEVALSVLVKRSETVAGRTFRMRPTLESRQQPGPVGEAESLWLPEIQGWEVESEPDGFELNGHGVVASARLDFGERRDGVQPGRVRLCVAPGQTDATFQPEPTRAILVEGAFEATLD